MVAQDSTSISGSNPEVESLDKSVDIQHEEHKPANFGPKGNNEKSTEQYVEDVGAEVGDLPGILHKDGRREIRQRNCYDKLGFSFPFWKKWLILSVIFICQVSMNFNAGFYPSAVSLIAEAHDISVPKARVSQLLMMVCYAFGCELWAPWSEEYGRWWVMQLSLFFTNIWQILGGLAPNYGSICVARALTGLSSAGGSVTLAIVADMWEADVQGYAVLFVVGSSVGGSAIAPIFGGIMADNLTWHWTFWIQLIIGGFAELLHLCFVWETRSTVLMDREAKRRRKTGEDDNIWGPTEIHPHKITFKECMTIWSRPFVMFLREPIVLCLSLLSGFSDALIFIFMESFGPTYAQWGFGNTASGLIFCAVLIGYIIGYALHFLDIGRQIHIFKKDGGTARFAERRLLLLLFLAPLEPIGLFIFGWTSFGPKMGIPWIAPTIAACAVGVANFSIYMATIDYMIMAYGPYSASATGGNGFARDFLAGISIMYATPMYMNIGKKQPDGTHSLHLQWASTILGILGVLVCIPIYVFYWKGPYIRRKSKFAQTLAADKLLENMPQDEYYKDHEENKEVA